MMPVVGPTVYEDRMAREREPAEAGSMQLPAVLQQ